MTPPPSSNLPHVSYVCCVTIFGLMLVFMVEIYYNPFNNIKNPFNGAKGLYAFVSCWPGPEGNQENSWLTFYSTGGLIFGIVNIVGNFGAVFVDQAYWQSVVATKPNRGVAGFLLGGMTWFAVPFGLATAMSLGYHGLSSAQGSAMLDQGQISSGLVVPLVSEALLDTLGSYATMVMMLAAVLSTGCAEILAVASIIIYDIYMPYIRPFKSHLPKGHCILCEKPLRGPTEEVGTTCTCPSLSECTACSKDDEARATVHGIVKPLFECRIHAEYRDYEAAVSGFKTWAIIYTCLAIIPVLWPAVIFGEAIGLDLGWIYLFTGVLVASAVIPVYLSLVWIRTTALGVSLGTVLGAVCALSAWMVHASTYPGGLSNFMANTGKSLPMMTGNVVAIAGGGIICAVVSLLTRNPETPEELKLWHSTRDIDNPLRPWPEKYKAEFDLKPTGIWHHRPSLEMFEEKYKREKRIAIFLGCGISIIMVLIWPLLMLESVVQDEARFLAWTGISQAWTYLAAFYIICFPLYEEIRGVYAQYRVKKAADQADVITPYVD